MAVVSFYTYGKSETGNTISAAALASYLGIEKNQKTILISTAFNDSTLRECFWTSQTKKRSGLFGPNTSIANENGIEGLDRIIRSNKISPDIITDYTKVVLTNRLEILLGYKGLKEQYDEIQKQYIQIISLASRCYDNVIVDIDKQLDSKTQKEILKNSDIVVALTTQKVSNINELYNAILEGEILKEENTLIVLGKYDEKLKNNVKNVSRNLLKRRDLVNTIPYNSLLFEDCQEGKIIDLFFKLLSMNSKDENAFFVEEVKRLSENIVEKDKELQMMKS